jgi:hypothetical protein
MTDREELGRLADPFTPAELAVRLDEWTRCLDASQTELRSDLRRAAVQLRRLAEAGTQEAEPVAWQYAAKGQGAPNWPAGVISMAHWENQSDRFHERPLYTAPPAPSVAVKVKALEWRRIGDCWKADRYSIRMDHGVPVYYMVSGWARGTNPHDTLESAKAAAQSDYEQRITSALITAPQDDVSTFCERCQGNGEIVTDWDEYLHPKDLASEEASLAECPDCDGQGTIAPGPSDTTPSRPEVSK